MIETIKIVSKCVGVNNKLDPKRLNINIQQTGLTELSEGVNIDIDDSGQIMTRLGQDPLSSVPSHSLFCDGGDGFVAQDRTSDCALYKINYDLTLTGIRSLLTKGAYLSYAQVGEKTYYTNSYQNGVVTDGVSAAWPIARYTGPTTLKVFSNAPVGHIIAWHKGRMWIAIDENGKYVIYCSAIHKPGTFRLAKNFFSFGSHIRMVRPVSGGVWVSDSETTGFIADAETWAGHRYEKKAQYPAHEGSVNCRLVDLSATQFEIPGLCAVWSSDEGLCIGTQDGQLIVATKNKLRYPTGSAGATLVDGWNVINTIY